MSEELPKSYDPKFTEEKWYSFWEKNRYFSADPNSSKPPFTIVIPPPNVTGSLHMGHALVNTLQDVLIRYKRMMGFEALWVPGVDHAGIATQTVVERHLMKTEGKRRVDYEREEFLTHVWKWKEENAGTILGQLKRLGASCDWSREHFTMDEQCSKAVKAIFKRLFDDGLIYRGDYLVNWDPVTQTALADDEVEYEEKSHSLWFFSYPIEGSDQTIHIATTRPETMLGDTAVAVSPKDSRYTDLIGKHVRLPLTNRLIPIIADHYVDPEFGTGAVKITPAHDPNDFEIGHRHNLESINIMTPDGKIALDSEFKGLSMLEARDAVVEALKKEGHLVKIEPITHRVGVSYRSKAIIEPFLSKQWFVKLSAFKQSLIDVVKSGEVKLIPKTWESTYFHWIENLRDWCISRQLWWGHRIPIWYNKYNPEQMICSDTDELPPEVAASPSDWIQEEDVLDTWFSSALWPFSTLGWPEQTPDLKRFYPNSTLITGHDILFFWVARMIAMGKYTFDKAPFPETFLHGLIYGKSYWRLDEQGAAHYVSAKERLSYDLGEQIPKDVHSKWEKMSKSKGNVIDPLEIIDSYGADAMRMALCSSATHARQIDLDRRRFEEFKNFANKMWNGARYVLMNLETLTPSDLSSPITTLQLEDRWILSVLSRITSQVQTAIDNYHFDQAATKAYDFFWNEFCAYYLEITKPTLFGKQGTPEEKKNKQKLLLHILLSSIRLLHPMAPFITEELFQILKKQYPSLPETTCPILSETLDALSSSACIVAPFPTPSSEDPKTEEDFSRLQQILHAIRTIRAEMQLPPSTPTDIHFVLPSSDPLYQLLTENLSIITSLIRTSHTSFTETPPSLPFSSSSQIGKLQILIPLPQSLRDKEQKRLEKEQEKLLDKLSRTQNQLANKQFLAKAPQQLVDNLKKTESDLNASLTAIKEKLADFS